MYFRSLGSSILRHLAYGNILYADLPQFVDQLFQITPLQAGEQAHLVPVWGMVQSLQRVVSGFFLDAFRDTPEYALKMHYPFEFPLSAV